MDDLEIDKRRIEFDKDTMTKQKIQERLSQRPFQPFKVRLTDGMEIDVLTGDHAHVHPNGRVLFVHLDAGGTKIIDIALITALHLNHTA